MASRALVETRVYTRLTIHHSVQALREISCTDWWLRPLMQCMVQHVAPTSFGPWALLGPTGRMALRAAAAVLLRGRGKASSAGARGKPTRRRAGARRASLPVQFAVHSALGPQLGRSVSPQGARPHDWFAVELQTSQGSVLRGWPYPLRHRQLGTTGSRAAWPTTIFLATGNCHPNFIFLPLVPLKEEKTRGPQ